MAEHRVVGSKFVLGDGEGAPHNRHLFGHDRIQQTGNDADGYEFENAVGFVVPFEKKWIDEAVEELYYGYPIRLPKGSNEEYAQALYAAGEQVKYPSYAPAAAIIDADIAYSDVLERIEDPQAIAETISKSRVELERLNPLIDEENKTIEGDLDKVLALYDIER